MAITKKIKFFNTFINKKVIDTVNGVGIPGWPGLPWNPAGYPIYPNNMNFEVSELENQWVIEEARIFGGYNNTSLVPGATAYVNEDNILQTNRFNALIYSGDYNSRTGVNRTNVFSVADSISTSCDPSYGDIQFTKSYDTNIIVCQANKISQILIDKDIIYTAEGGTSTRPPGTVLGQIIPYAGDFGISDDAQSFADYGFRKYFTDSWRGVVLRLTIDGLTVISENGMKDYFRDRFSEMQPGFKRFNVKHTTNQDGTLSVFTTVDNVENVEFGMGLTIDNIQQSPTVVNIDYNTNEITMSNDVIIPVEAQLEFYKLVEDKIIGGYDNFDGMYIVSLNKTATTPDSTNEYNTLSFDETVKGWNCFYTYDPTNMFSLKNAFFSTKNGFLWKHHNESGNNSRGIFYNVYNKSYVDFIFNQNPSTKKVFNTISYEGNNGFEVQYITSDPQEFDLVVSQGQSTFESFEDEASKILSYEEGEYTINGYSQRAGFNRKENLYVANLINDSSARPGQILSGPQISGIKGYFARVKISTDSSTDVGGYKELWSVGTNFVASS